MIDIATTCGHMFLLVYSISADAADDYIILSADGFAFCLSAIRQRTHETLTGMHRGSAAVCRRSDDCFGDGGCASELVQYAVWLVVLSWTTISQFVSTECRHVIVDVRNKRYGYHILRL